MRSQTTAAFRKGLESLPPHVRAQAQRAYEVFCSNPNHPGLRFKPVHPSRPIYSVRIGNHYRALGVLEGETSSGSGSALMTNTSVSSTILSSSKVARRSARFVVCVDRGGNEDLPVGRIYRVLPDAGARQVHYVRIVDDSEEDYLYPSQLFLSFYAPPSLRQALEEAGV